MVHTFACGPVDTNCYVVTHPADGVAFLVDCPPESHDKVMAALKLDACALTDIILTHTHWDHTVDCLKIQNSTGARVWVHANDVHRLLDPNRHTVWPLSIEIDAVTNVHLFDFSKSEEIELRIPSRIANSSFLLRVLQTPGHTEGGVCFVDDVDKLIYAGDTLFRGSVGRTDLPGGDMSILVESIRNRLFKLDDDYTVLPGHGPETSIGHERNSNMFVGDNAQ